MVWNHLENVETAFRVTTHVVGCKRLFLYQAVNQICGSLVFSRASPHWHQYVPLSPAHSLPLHCGWFRPSWQLFLPGSQSSAGAYTGKVKVTGYSVPQIKRDQPRERQRENIPSGEELIEPVDFRCMAIPQLIGRTLLLQVSAFEMRTWERFSTSLQNTLNGGALDLRSQTSYMCLSAAVRSVFPQ